MAIVTDLFFELIQISLGNKVGFERAPSEQEWSQLFDLSCMHSLVSVTWDGVNKLKNASHNANFNININLMLEWIGIQQLTIVGNNKQNQRTKELCEIFNKAGFQCCVLKGQGTALYYEHPEYRQCGDIDIWVKGDRDVILNFARMNGYHVGHIDIKHSNIKFFEDVPVEVHFLPSWMYNPFANNKLQNFFIKHSECQFCNKDAEAGFVHTTVDFDLVFSIVHIYRHFFSEGIGLRQLMDYYQILKNSSNNQRNEAYSVLKSMKMKDFCGGIMWILKKKFGMKDEYLLCTCNSQQGVFLLSEIMTAGNFGHYDVRIKRIDVEKRFTRGFEQFKRNWRFVRSYPSEVLWSPFWKMWHWCWRRMKGYL